MGPGDATREPLVGFASVLVQYNTIAPSLQSTCNPFAINELRS
jgi:hypothetical protein